MMAVELFEHLVGSMRDVGEGNPSIFVFRCVAEVHKVLVTVTSLASTTNSRNVSRGIIVWS
jgi:hypothetical protein